MKQFGTILTALMLLVVGITLVQAAPQDAQATTGATGQYSAPAPNNVTAGGGNVTAVDVSSDASTGKWAGFWGNITGSLQLGDGADIFYNWTGVAFQSVYASPGNNIDWGTVSGVPDTSLTGKDTDYGFTSSDADSINSTMTGSTCATATTTITGAAGVTPYNSVGAAGSWETCIAEDSGAGVTDTVFGTDIVEAGADAYNGQNVQYQLMVPVNATSQLYYFYLEI